MLVDALYDMTIGVKMVDGQMPSMKHVKNGVKLDAKIYVRRIPLSDIPTEKEKSIDYLYKLYKEKVRNVLVPHNAE